MPGTATLFSQRQDDTPKEFEHKYSLTESVFTYTQEKRRRLTRS